jgi:hypothetical protein
LLNKKQNKKIFVQLKVSLAPTNAAHMDTSQVASGANNARELDGIDGMNGLINNAESRSALLSDFLPLISPFLKLVICLFGSQ